MTPGLRLNVFNPKIHLHKRIEQMANELKMKEIALQEAKERFHGSMLVRWRFEKLSHPEMLARRVLGCLVVSDCDGIADVDVMFVNAKLKLKVTSHEQKWLMERNDFETKIEALEKNISGLYSEIQEKNFKLDRLMKMKEVESLKKDATIREEYCQELSKKFVSQEIAKNENQRTISDLALRFQELQEEHAWVKKLRAVAEDQILRLQEELHDAKMSSKEREANKIEMMSKSGRMVVEL
eukprot:648871-Hanusia_phi.AAC.1